MIIQADTRQKKKHHILKEKFFAENGIQVVSSKMLVGDYCIPGNGSVAVDTKQNINELYADMIQDHDRFHNECVLAKQCGIKLIILVENTCGVKSVDEIKRWKNPRLFVWINQKKKAAREHKAVPKPPASNEALIKSLHTMEKEYGVIFDFCTPAQAGGRIIELLGGSYGN